MPAEANRAHVLYRAAVEIGDPGAVSVFLDKACRADADLRRQVDGLLAAHAARPERPGSTPSALSSPEPLPATVGFDAKDDLAKVGAIVAGRYKLLQAIGHGGMGMVFMAQQLAPVKRQVAVKLIKPGMDSKAVLARFEAERQALALMDHPNIAKVLDGGTTESGSPYFVMELVRGTPITEFCDERKLAPRDRLNLFITVCQAVQHAHQKGIIHRDLKPTNVMVELHDDRPVARVIDFGVAKAVGQQLTEHTLFTGFGAVVGTPAYMSPEQASFNALDVDTRSDVYSLGALLYELLAGTPPFDPQELKKAAMDEALRMVREQEPPKPSTRLTSSQQRASIAAGRKMEPAKLGALLRGDLDWIVMKCLEKDRTRRYDTANALAGDLQRYLADEPVSAGPPSTTYRLRKFLKKRRGAVLAGLGILLALVIGIVAASWGMIRAMDAEQQALRERDKKDQALLTAERARAAEQEQRRKADAQGALIALDQALVTLRQDRKLGLLSLAKLLPTIPEHAVALRQYVTMAILTNGQLLRPLVGDRHAWKHVYLTPSGRILGVKATDRDIEQGGLWDPLTGQPLAQVSIDGGSWESEVLRAVGGNGRFVLIRPVQGGPIYVLDTQTGTIIGKTTEYDGNISSHQISDDGSMVLTIGSSTKGVMVWDVKSGRSWSPGGSCWSLRANGEHVLRANRGETVEVVTAARGDLIATLKGLPSPVINVEFSPSGKVACVVAGDAVYWVECDGWRLDPSPHRLPGAGVTGSAAAVTGSAAELVFLRDDVVALGQSYVIKRGGPVLPTPEADSNAAQGRTDGSLFLSEKGVLFDLATQRRVPSGPGRIFAAEMKRFAVDGRLLDRGDLMDLETERPLIPGAALQFESQLLPGIGRLLAYSRAGEEATSSSVNAAGVILLPPWDCTVDPQALTGWVNLLARGELDAAGSFVPWSEEQWQAKRTELANHASRSAFPFPGAVVRDRCYWLADELAAYEETNPKVVPLLSRLIATEPTWLDYHRRAGACNTNRQAVLDELEAGRRSSIRYWSRYSKSSYGWWLGFESGAKAADYEAGLRWCQEREHAGIADPLPTRALLLHRLGRHDDVLTELRRRGATREAVRATELFLSPWVLASWHDEANYDRLLAAIALSRVGQKENARARYQEGQNLKIMVESGNRSVVDEHYAQLLKEAEILLAEKQPGK